MLVTINWLFFLFTIYSHTVYDLLIYFITSNTFTYFQEAGERKERQEATVRKVFKSNTHPISCDIEIQKSDDTYHFVDTLAIIQDVTFKLEASPAPKLHWWNRVGIWLSKLWRE